MGENILKAQSPVLGALLFLFAANFEDDVGQLFHHRNTPNFKAVYLCSKSTVIVKINAGLCVLVLGSRFLSPFSQNRGV